MPKIVKNVEGEISDILKQGTLSLIDNDRPYSSEEEEAEKQAIRFSVTNFPRVPPIPGTLGFLFRNISGGNASVIKFMQEASGTNESKFIKNFLILWNIMDEYSRNRVDIFDILCEKFNVKKKKFWGVVQEGMYDHNDALSQISLSGHKGEFIELLKKMARLPKNHKDRELLALALGLKKEKAFLELNDNSNHQTNVQVNNTQVNNLPSFAQSMRRYDEDDNIIDGQVVEEPKQLSEGNQEYINNNNNAWLAAKKTEADFALIEKNLMESSKEMR